jgi:hypothetical protein
MTDSKGKLKSGGLFPGGLLRAAQSIRRKAELEECLRGATAFESESLGLPVDPIPEKLREAIREVAIPAIEQLEQAEQAKRNAPINLPPVNVPGIRSLTGAPPINPQLGLAPQEGARTDRPTRNAPSRLNFRSEFKRAVLVQLTKNPNATDLEICRSLDDDGSAELPESWKGKAGDRLFADAYMDPLLRHKIETPISKVRAEMRKVHSLPPR